MNNVMVNTISKAAYRFSLTTASDFMLIKKFKTDITYPHYNLIFIWDFNLIFINFNEAQVKGNLVIALRVQLDDLT